MLRPSESFVRFAVVGLVGFVVDGGVMQLLISTAGYSPLLARTFSFPLALTLTWALNRNWTFEAGRHRGHASQYARYLAVQVAGFAINYAVFAACVTASEIGRRLPLLSLVFAALISMVFTYVVSRRFVFSEDLSSAGPS
jgi:putative flippase GtrA